MPAAADDSDMEKRPGIQIGRRWIGEGHGVFVIAEAGVNHGGHVDTAQRLIDAAREAGADAVKFQAFSAERLVARDAPLCSYQKASSAGAAGQYEILRSLELQQEEFAALAVHAAKAGIAFLATPFGLDELRMLCDLGVPAIKIASTDLVNVPLVDAAASSGRPVILSTGASNLAEVDAAVERFSSLGARRRLIPLHCVSSYPTRPEEARLRCMGTLASRYGVHVGFSDHTDDAGFGALAVAAGAVVLEKHLTLDRSASGPDHFFSLEPRAFTEYVASARKAQLAMGDGVIECSASERQVRELARGSVVATESIPAGKRLTTDLLAIRRPGVGIAPDQWSQLIGRVAKTDIPADTRLTWAMIQ
jgi:sialic acid synthase SpsE